MSGSTLPWDKYSQSTDSGPWTKYAQPQGETQPQPQAEPGLPANSVKPNPSMPTARFKDYSHDIENNPQTSELAGQVGILGAGALGAAGAGELPVIGPAMSWMGEKIAPYVKPALASYAISKAKELPVVGPIIKHIPFAEALPWLFSGKKEAEGEPVAPTEPTAPPERVDPSLTSPSRTMPGQIAPEIISPRPIPGVNARPFVERVAPDRGLLLKGNVEASPRDTILQKMQPYADKIMREGHGPEPIEEPETSPQTNIEEDLSPALRRSVKKVKAAKQGAQE